MLELPQQSWNGKVAELKIGSTESDGGSRKTVVNAGGASTLPFLFFDGEIPRTPIIGMKVSESMLDTATYLSDSFGDIANNPTKWAKECANRGTQIIDIELESVVTEKGKRSLDEGVEFVSSILKAVDLPIIIHCPNTIDDDDELISACTKATEGENCAIGIAKPERYKSIAKNCLKHGHTVIAQSSIDFNLAKQLNILLMDMGVEKNRILIDPLSSSLGYGLEYTYSVIERIRLAALNGDETLQMPIICDASVAWNAREVKQNLSSDDDESIKLGVYWESITALSYILAGADIIILQHPRSVEIIKENISELTSKEAKI